MVGGVKVRRRPTFLGDTVNTTARIEATCKEHGAPQLASEDLVQRLEDQNEFLFDDVGPVTLRGKTDPLRLFRLQLPRYGVQ